MTRYIQARERAPAAVGPYEPPSTDQRAPPRISAAGPDGSTRDVGIVAFDYRTQLDRDVRGLHDAVVHGAVLDDALETRSQRQWQAGGPDVQTDRAHAGGGLC